MNNRKYNKISPGNLTTIPSMDSSISVNSNIEDGLRILIVTQGVSRVVRPLLASEHNVVAVLESAPRMFKQKSYRYRILDFLRNILSFLKPEVMTLKRFCKIEKIPYHYLISGESPRAAEWVKLMEPEIIVVYSMSQLLKREIYAIPTYGTINLHSSFLPEYRGPNPDFWQYYDMEMSPGVTIHYIDAGEDTGDIILQERVHIPLGTKSPQRLDKLIGKTGVALILKALTGIQHKTLKGVKQPAVSPTQRARNLRPDEHFDVINWNKWSIERVWHVLRGTELWLNALPKPNGKYIGQRWVISTFAKANGMSSTPGRIYCEDGRWFVICRDGKIYLELRFSLKRLLLHIVRLAG